MSRLSLDLINDVIHNLPHSETERFGDCKPDSIGLFQAQLLQSLEERAPLSRNLLLFC